METPQLRLGASADHRAEVVGEDARGLVHDRCRDGLDGSARGPLREPPELRAAALSQIVHGGRMKWITAA
jgi:hypothetical protein